MASSRLPDASRLLLLSRDECGALAARLRAIGVDAEHVGPVSRVCEGMLNPLPRPMRLWHLRRMRDPLGYALRLFVFDDPVTHDEAQQALGDLPLPRLLDVGLVSRLEDGRVASPFLLSLIGPLYVLCDDLRRGGDAVMGAGTTTGDLGNAVRPGRHLQRALDLGCGAGTVALVLAKHAESVVATDINPRAVTLARFNAALNGLSNIDFRVGDLFGPVAGEAFDLIVSQPPFIAHPEGASTATWLYGGARGDELPLKLLTALPPHLREGGRAVIMVEWPVVDDVPHERRVREALQTSGAPLQLLLLQSPPGDLDEHCTAYGLGGQLDPEFEQRALRRRDHFETMGIRGLRLTINIIERAEPEWTASIDMRPLRRARLGCRHVDRIVKARSLLASVREALLGATLRAADGLSFAEVPNGRVRVTFPDLLEPVEVGKAAAQLVQRVHEAPDVRTAVEAFAPTLGMPPSDAVEKCLDGVRQALRFCVLVVE